MLVYALEYADDNEACDRNLQGFLDTAESTKSLPPSSTLIYLAGSASAEVIADVALCPFEAVKVLCKLSLDLLEVCQMDFLSLSDQKVLLGKLYCIIGDNPYWR
ncbi:hypothetical protein ACFX14_021422 [Malus domestica]